MQILEFMILQVLVSAKTVYHTLQTICLIFIAQLFELNGMFNIPTFIMKYKPILVFVFPLGSICQFFFCGYAQEYSVKHLKIYM